MPENPQHPIEQLREHIEVSQRNTVFPDTLRGGRDTDAILWKGSSRATPVQRIGIAIFGFLFLISAISLMSLWLEGHGRFFLLFSIPWFALSIRMFWNAFKKNTAKPMWEDEDK